MVGDIVIDAPEVQAFAFLVPPHLADDAGPFQLAKDEITLHVGVGIGRVGDLEGQFRQRDPCVPRAGADLSPGPPCSLRSATASMTSAGARLGEKEKARQPTAPLEAG